MMSVSRRLFLGRLFSAMAAPAIVHAGNLMPVKAIDPILFSQSPWWNGTVAWMGPVDYAELAAITRQAFLPRLHAQLYKQLPAFQMFVGD
jgi:hypothetical protein